MQLECSLSRCFACGWRGGWHWLQAYKRLLTHRQCGERLCVPVVGSLTVLGNTLIQFAHRIGGCIGTFLGNLRLFSSAVPKKQREESTSDEESSNNTSISRNALAADASEGELSCKCRGTNQADRKEMHDDCFF